MRKLCFAYFFDWKLASFSQFFMVQFDASAVQIYEYFSVVLLSTVPSWCQGPVRKFFPVFIANNFDTNALSSYKDSVIVSD